MGITVKGRIRMTKLPKSGMSMTVIDRIRMTKLPKRWDEYDGEPVEEVEPCQEGQPKQPEPDQQVHLHQTVSHKIVIMYLLYKYMYRTLSTN